ncbi:MAG: OPT/YSL family transporter [Peptococcaceae bacterium]
MSEQNDNTVDPIELMIDEAMKKPHPQTLNPIIFVVTICVSILGAIIGMELITSLGVNPNTSIIGALIAVAIGFIPLKMFDQFRSIHTQNLVETGISAATFGAGNVMIYALSVCWLLGLTDIIPAMLVGASIGMLIDITVLYWLYDTSVFPAKDAWPLGIATSETILAATEKGKKALILVCGAVVGAFGSWIKIPMDIIGICTIGNLWALSMFCIGLILRGYVCPWFNFKLDDYYIPHGMMIGAGLVAMIQIWIIISKESKKKKMKQMSLKTDAELATTITETIQPGEPTRSADDMKKGLIKGYVLFTLGAIAMVVIAGLWTDMSLPWLIGFILFTAVAAIATELMIGISAMHSGWFPGVATTLIFLVLGVLIGFPISAMALITGYAASTGPAFADMGYDLKAGWILRGKGKNPAFELEGRKQQYIAELLGGIVAIIIGSVAYTGYFVRDLVPPASRVLAKTIEAGINPEIIKWLAIFAIFGGLIQFIGGPEKQLGILLSTGLLITNPKAGIFGLATIIIRFIIEKKWGSKAMDQVIVFGAGLIAGSALFSFFNGTIGNIKKKL